MKRILGLVGLLIVILVPLTFFPFQIPFYRDVYNDVVLDNYDHWLPCSEWPTIAQVKKAISQNHDTLKRINTVPPKGRGIIDMYVDDTTCAGRGDLVIEYGGHKEREQIEAILGDHIAFAR